MNLKERIQSIKDMSEAIPRYVYSSQKISVAQEAMQAITPLEAIIEIQQEALESIVLQAEHRKEWEIINYANRALEQTKQLMETNDKH